MRGFFFLIPHRLFVSFDLGDFLADCTVQLYTSFQFSEPLKHLKIPSEIKVLLCIFIKVCGNQFL